MDEAAKEFRAVEVEIKALGKSYSYYMTNDLELLFAELKRLDCVAPKRYDWRANTALAPEVRAKMTELGVQYSLCESAGVLNYYAGETPYIVFFRDILDPEKYMTIPVAKISEIIDRCEKVSESYKEELELLRSREKKIYGCLDNFCQKMLSGLGLIQEYYGASSPDTLKKYFGKSAEELRSADIIERKTLTFPDLLRQFRDERAMKDVDLYRKASISKQTYHNIISGKVVPTRESAIALSFALHLNLEDTKRLLGAAGHSFLPADAFSHIIKECLSLGKDLTAANEKLYKAGIQPLGDALK